VGRFLVVVNLPTRDIKSPTAVGSCLKVFLGSKNLRLTVLIFLVDDQPDSGGEERRRRGVPLEAAAASSHRYHRLPSRGMKVVRMVL
jgi:hypothetical protein